MRRQLCICILATLLTLTGCQLVYQPPLDQGVQFDSLKIKKGMTKQEVTQALGHPLLETPLENQLIYVNSSRTGHQPTFSKQLIINFKNGVVSSINESKGKILSR